MADFPLNYFDPERQSAQIQNYFLPVPTSRSLIRRVSERLGRMIYARHSRHIQATSEARVRHDFPKIARVQDLARENGGLAGKYQFIRLLEIFKLLNLFKPNNALELGSGTSSSVFADYFKDAKRFTTVEESPYWYDRMLSASKEYIQDMTPLLAARRVIRLGKHWACHYEIDHSIKYDFIYVDGPSNIAPDGNHGPDGKTPHIPCVDVELLWKNEVYPRFIVIDGRRATLAHLITNSNNRYRSYLRTDYSLPAWPWQAFAFQYHTILIRHDIDLRNLHASE